MFKIVMKNQIIGFVPIFAKDGQNIVAKQIAVDIAFRSWLIVNFVINGKNILIRNA